MKVIYIGSYNKLSETVLERLKKEEHDSYIISDSEPRNIKCIARHKKYMISEHMEEINDIIASISPEVIIFAGFYDSGIENIKKNTLSLPVVLENSVKSKVGLFVYLSSSTVYGDVAGIVTETTEVHPNTELGVHFLQSEKTIDLYHTTYGLNTVVLRIETLFSNKVDELGFAEKVKCTVTENNTKNVKKDFMQPINVSDVADAIQRVVVSGKNATYNLVSSEVISYTDVYSALQNKKYEKNNNEKVNYISTEKIRKDLEWIDFWQWGEMAENGKIDFNFEIKETPSETKRKNNKAKDNIRKIIENLVVAAFFGVMYFVTLDHSLFSQINWLLIYIVVISAFYGIKYGTFAISMASVIYLFAEKETILSMTNFYSYIENILTIAQFIFFGIVIGYTIDRLKEDKRILEKEKELQNNSYQRLKEINEKVILVKNEYEKRILDTKDSLPRLYSVINKINVLDEERIFAEVLNVVKDLLKTNTVAVYRVNKNNSYLRLITSLNEESIVEGRSWNLQNNPQIREAIEKNEVYEGDIWNGEPASVLPIHSSKGCVAIIVIKELPGETMSLYTVNLLRTLLLLVSQSIEKAIQYDNATRSQKYIEDTDVLVPEEFEKVVELAIEKKKREMSDFSIINIEVETTLIDTYQKVANLFREVDIFGTDGSKKLYVLLDNTTIDNNSIIFERLQKNGVKAYIMQNVGV